LLIIIEINSHLLSVINLIRHGARTPQSFPFITKKLNYGHFKSQLTINGLRQLQLLGRYTNQKYIKQKELLKVRYNPNDSKFYSSPSQRAIFSGTAFLHGLYKNYIIKPIFHNEKSNFKTDSIPPIPDFNIENKIKYKEIPLHIKNSYNNKIFHPHKCKLTKESNEIIKEMGFIKRRIFPDISNDDLIEAIDDIKYHLPYLFTDLKPEEYYTRTFLSLMNSYLKQVRPTLKIKFDFKPLTKQVMRMTNIEKHYSSRLIESKGIKLSASGFFSGFINYFDRIVNNDESKKKYILYSGHDTNIISILTNLLDKDYLLKKCLEGKESVSAHNFLIMPFASSFILELHSNNDAYGKLENYFVKIILNGEEIKEGLHKDLVYYESLGGFEYNQFKSYLQSRIDPNYDDIFCSNDDDFDYTK